MFRVSATPIISSTQSCNYSLPPTWPSLATLEGGSCTKNMSSTGSCSYSFVYSWWWVWLTPEICRIINRLLCVASRWTIINVYYESEITCSSQVSRILSKAKHRPRQLYPILYKPFLHQLRKVSNNVCSSYLAIYTNSALQLPNFQKELLRIITKLGRIKPTEILKGKLLVWRPMKVISEG